MAGYPKIWTTLWSSPNFRSLSGAERGVLMQLILWCKHERDDGLVLAESYTKLGIELGFSRQTASRMMAKLDRLGYTESVQNGHGQLLIRLPMYSESQQLTAKEASERARKWPGKPSKLDREKNTTRPDQTRPDQTKAKHKPAEKPPDPVDDFVKKYHEICRGFKQARIINKSRRGKIRQRLKELAEAGVTVEEYMHKIANSPFLRGDRGNWDGAGFDFIIGAQNIGKILDGKYDRRDSDIDWANIGGDDDLA